MIRKTDEYRKYAREYAKKHRNARICRVQKDYQYRMQYGISLTQAEDLEKNQNGLCPICCLSLNEGGRKSLDHCHKNGTPRGILHWRCNILLGMCNDNADVLLNAIAYLKKHKT